MQRSRLGEVTPGEAPSGRALLGAVGGIRGLIEAILPGLGFLVLYTITQELWLSVLDAVRDRRRRSSRCVPSSASR